MPGHEGGNIVYIFSLFCQEIEKFVRAKAKAKQCTLFLFCSVGFQIYYSCPNGHIFSATNGVRTSAKIFCQAFTIPPPPPHFTLIQSCLWPFSATGLVPILGLCCRTYQLSGLFCHHVVMLPHSQIGNVTTSQSNIWMKPSYLVLSLNGWPFLPHSASFPNDQWKWGEWVLQEAFSPHETHHPFWFSPKREVLQSFISPAFFLNSVRPNILKTISFPLPCI